MTMPNLTRLSLKEARKRIESDNSMSKSQLHTTLLHIIEALLTKPNDVSKEVALLLELCANNVSALSTPIPKIEIELNYILAICYREGLGIGMDIKKARNMFENIIQQYPHSISKLLCTPEPHSYALVELAVSYMGNGLTQNIDVVLDCLSTAARKGNSLAQYHLSRLYKGQYVVGGPEKANEYLLLAARAGLAVAQYDLAMQLAISSKQNNDGKTHDESCKLTGDRIRQSYNWFKLASANGHPDANYRLGRYYEQGYAEGNIQKNFKRAAGHYLTFLQHISSSTGEALPAESKLKYISNFAKTLIFGSEDASQSEENVQLGHKLTEALANKVYNSAKIDSPLLDGAHDSAGRTPSPIEMRDSQKLRAEQNSSSNSPSSASSNASSSYSIASQESMIVENQVPKLENFEDNKNTEDEELSDVNSSSSSSTPRDVKTNADTMGHTQNSAKTLKSLRIPRPSTDPALVFAAFKLPQPLSTIASVPLQDLPNNSKSALVFSAFNPPKQNQSSASLVYCEEWARQMLNEQSMQTEPQSQATVLTFSSNSQSRQNPIAKTATSLNVYRTKMDMN